MIDVRDLGEWIIHVIEQKITGTFNAIGPKGGMTMGQMVEGIKKGLDVKDATFTYVPIEALEKAQDPNVMREKFMELGLKLRDL